MDDEEDNNENEINIDVDENNNDGQVLNRIEELNDDENMMNDLQNNEFEDEVRNNMDDKLRMRTRSSNRPVLEVRKLMEINIDRTDDTGRTRSGRLFTNDVANIVSEEVDVINDPNSFQDAWDNPDEIAKMKWREAIKKEFGDLKDRNVWRVIQRQ